MGDLLKAIYTIGQTKSVCYWFQSYFTNRLLLVNFGEIFSQAVNISSGAPQVFILGPLLIFIYFNDIPKAVKCNLFLYADDSYLVSQKNVVNEIKKQH